MVEAANHSRISRIRRGEEPRMLKELVAAVDALKALPPTLREVAIKEATRRKRRRRVTRKAKSKTRSKLPPKKKVSKGRKPGPKPKKEKIEKLRRFRKETEPETPSAA